MGKKWDSTGIAYNVDLWKECLRVLKPGGHMLAFGGTRTYHRMACAIEDAGFEIRDCIQWLYGSGFPKSHNISKAIDKKLGVEREVIGKGTAGKTALGQGSGWNKTYNPHEYDITRDETEQAKRWSGWGTALKPANEPIVLARKPLSEKTIAENVMKWGTGGINIDACRIEYQKGENPTVGGRHKKTGRRIGAGSEKFGFKSLENPEINLQGRFPANVILDEEAGRMLDEQQEGASRFFYCAKASKKERGEGNNHPTVKPVKLMEYLITLITPPNGIVLDPFLGSGTTAIACINTNRNYIGFELDKQYYDIANARICKAISEH
jgi:site-specific DNA-methyltransferase (adenine-specific)